jgi:glycosidase
MKFNPLPIQVLLLIVMLFSFSCKPKKSVIEPEAIQEPITEIELDPLQYETPFLGVPNTSDIVMYEINERAFSTAGNFAGIVSRLDSIKNLGVNTIWLMPTYPIGTIKSINSPYCIKNYKEVNPEFGNLEDLRTLVREAHQRNMSVILDWVANHTAWDNPWIANKAWYTQDGSGNIVIPPGTSWQDVADLNFDNNEMRQKMIKAMKYWVLAANIDGYRCDAADLVPYSFWKQAIDSLKNIKNRTLILLAEGNRNDHFSAGFQMNFDWDFYGMNKDVFKNNLSAINYYFTHQYQYTSIPLGSHKLRFTSNHDECAWDNTPIVLFGGKDASITAFVISSFIGGVPLIYNGQEVGCPVKLPFFSKSPIDWTTNPNMLKAYKRLLSVRATHSVLRYGALTNFSDSNTVAFKRSNTNEEMLVIANTRNVSVNYTIPSTIQNVIWKDAFADTIVPIINSFNLSPYQYRILKKL